MSEQRPRTEAEIVELIRSIDVRAPQELHDRIDALIAEHGERSAQRGWGRFARGSAAPVRLGFAGALVLG